MSSREELLGIGAQYRKSFCERAEQSMAETMKNGHAYLVEEAHKGCTSLRVNILTSAQEAEINLNEVRVQFMADGHELFHQDYGRSCFEAGIRPFQEYLDGWAADGTGYTLTI